MSEHQKQSLPQDAPLAPLFHTILAAENKTSELFVKSFQYQGENIATKHLGQIFGFFEIPDTQEDNAYIVNFLASVVKKEYFANPKRSATDSFEAALHKINLALAELVRQGNTAWLGKLHGVVAVMENNTFHFSVTGDGTILLYRDNQVTPISEGLADKDAALHPLKTFLEISSGALLPQDKILITSPELLALCNQETLRKNAFRMDKNGFARYVRAAIVNELPLGVSLIIDLDVAPAPARPPKKKARALKEASREKLQNVFSGSSFQEPKASPEPEEVAPVTNEEEELLPPREYTDKKTGHIYVQGEAHQNLYKESSSWQTFSEERLRPLFISLGLFLKRLTKKGRKAIAKQAGFLGSEGKNLSQNLWKLSKEKGSLLTAKSAEALKNRAQNFKKGSQKTGPAELEETSLAYETFDEVHKEYIEVPETTLPHLNTELPEELAYDDEPLSRRKKALERFSPNYEWSPTSKKGGLKQALLALLKGVASVPRSLFILFQNFSSKQKMIGGGAAFILILIILSFTLFSSSSPSEEASSPAAPAPPQPSIREQAAPPALRDAATRISWQEGEGLFVMTAENTPIVVTPKNIVTPDKTFPFVANGTIETATFMPDLRMIFLWSSSKELVSWSTVDKKFTANNFPVPANTQVSALGAYLTYLYALDNNAGTIHRFARTEGGFGEPTSWLRSPLPKGSVQDFVVNDTIRIASTTLDQYSRGTKERTLSESSYQVLGSSSNRTFTLGVETGAGKLTVWNADGNQVFDSAFEELKGIQAVTYNEETRKLLVTKGQNLMEYTLEW